MRQWYTYLSSDDDAGWYAQYGAPNQASRYPNLRKRRAKIAQKLVKKGFSLKVFGNVVQSQRPKNAPRFWGLGGKDYPKPKLP